MEEKLHLLITKFSVVEESHGLQGQLTLTHLFLLAGILMDNQHMCAKQDTRIVFFLNRFLLELTIPLREFVQLFSEHK